MEEGYRTYSLGFLQLALASPLTTFISGDNANRASLHALYYHDEAVAFPPCCPIPGRNEDDTAYATIRWPSHILPSYMGQTFAALCKFWTIVQEIIVVYQSPQGTTAKDHVPFAFVESKYQKLLHWADTVVLDMVQENTKPAHSIFFQ